MAALANYADVLHSTALAYVATIGPHGEPQVNPVWFGWDGQHVLFSQTKVRQKYRNVQRDARIALSIVDPKDPYRYLEIRGKVVEIREDPNRDFINAMAKKYLDEDVNPWAQPSEERVVIVVLPERTTQLGG
jgi:PPOX class probable F420-dependent enzyme